MSLRAPLLCLALVNGAGLALAAQDPCDQATQASQAALSRANARQQQANSNLASAIQQAATCQSQITGVVARVIPSLATTSTPAGSVLNQLASAAANTLSSAACSALNQAVSQGTNAVMTGNTSGISGSAIGAAFENNVSSSANSQVISGGNSAIVSNVPSAVAPAAVNLFDQLACKASGTC